MAAKGGRSRPEKAIVGYPGLRDTPARPSGSTPGETIKIPSKLTIVVCRGPCKVQHQLVDNERAVTTPLPEQSLQRQTEPPAAST